MSSTNGHAIRQMTDRQASQELAGMYAFQLAAQRGGDAVDQEFSRQMSEIHAGYFAGGTTRFLPRPPGIQASGSGADYHYQTESNYFLMVERARFDDRENMMLGQGINRMVANIVQNGFALQVQTGDDSIDADLTAAWNEWANDPDACDYDGERDFEQIARGLLRNRTVDGDIFALPTTGGNVQVVENHRVRNPFGARTKITDGTGVVHGVELRNNRRVAFHFTRDDLSATGQITRKTRMRRISARDRGGNRQVFQVYDPRRFSQRRGVTAFAPIVFPTRYHDDLQFAALVNAKRSSFIALFRELAQDIPALPGRDRQAGTRTEVTREDGTTRTEEAGMPGQTVRGNPGERLKPWAPNIPAASFFDHSDMLLGFVACNLDLPIMVFKLDASQTNFNGYRGVIDQARMRFTQIQSDMIVQFHSPCFKWKVRQWMQRDPALRSAANRSEINILGHRWTPRGWPYIQPVQDAAADDLRLAKNLISGRRRAQERGIDFDDLTTEIVEDRATLIRKALKTAEEINRDFTDAGVTWREIAYGGDTAVKVSLSGTLDDNDDEPTEPNRSRRQAEPRETPDKESGSNDQAE